MIEIRNLTTFYDNEKVLEIENLNFEEGKITAIVGLNGSGKSTLLKSIVGINPCEGELIVEGKNIKKLGHKKRARLISYLPQSNPVANMDIFTLVCHGRFPYLGYSKIPGKKDLEIVEKALKLTDLWEIRYKNLNEISGGERQRSYLAMVIAQNTKMILLDEPATYMDIKHQIEILEMLKKLADEGRGIVFTSHDLPQSFSVCNKVCLMKKGGIAATGSPQEISSNKELMKSAMGVCLKNNDDKELIYKYALSS